jgi:hypothetical protein
LAFVSPCGYGRAPAQQQGLSDERPNEEKTSQKLAGKVAVITEGSSGIGLATARKFVKEGAALRRETNRYRGPMLGPIGPFIWWG